MTVKFREELMAILLSLAVLVAIFILPNSDIRIYLGLPLLLFFPGYCFISALFPRKSQLSFPERILLGFGTSVVIVPLLGLLLNLTSYGINLISVVCSCMAWIFITSLTTLIRRRYVPSDELSYFEFRLGWHHKSPNQGEKLLKRILALSMISMAVVIVVVMIRPKSEKGFVEFYLLGPGDKAENYPVEAKLGENVSVIVGITSHEKGTHTYRLEVQIEGETPKNLQFISLKDGEGWQNQITFVPNMPGNNIKVYFLLYMNGNVSVMVEPLYITLNVTP